MFVFMCVGFISVKSVISFCLAACGYCEWLFSSVWVLACGYPRWFDMNNSTHSHTDIFDTVLCIDQHLAIWRALIHECGRWWRWRIWYEYKYKIVNWPFDALRIFREKYAFSCRVKSIQITIYELLCVFSLVKWSATGCFGVEHFFCNWQFD